MRATIRHGIRTSVIKIHAFTGTGMQVGLHVGAVGGAAGREVHSRLHIQALGQEPRLYPCENSRKLSDRTIGISNDKYKYIHCVENLI